MAEDSQLKSFARWMADEVERTKSSVGNRIVEESKRERGLRSHFPTERSESKRKKDRRNRSTSSVE